MIDLSITLADLANSASPTDKAELAAWAALLSPAEPTEENLTLADEIAALPPVGQVTYLTERIPVRVGRMIVYKDVRKIITTHHNPNHNPYITKEYR